jgi:single-strand DNA-binding protein
MVNTATLVGRVGKDVESSQANGKTVAKFSLATTETYKDKSGEKVENTTWHNIVVLGFISGHLRQVPTERLTCVFSG